MDSAPIINYCVQRCRCNWHAPISDVDEEARHGHPAGEPRAHTAQLYGRRRGEISLDEVERVVI